MRYYRRQDKRGRNRASTSSSGKKSYCLLINQASGNEPEVSLRLAQKLERRLRRSGGDYRVEIAVDWEQFERLLNDAVYKRPSTLIVFGGDSSVCLAAAQISRGGGLLGIVPCGKYNNIFASLYGHSDADVAIDVVHNGYEKRIDCGLANGQFFVGSLVSGLLPAMIERIGDDRLPRLSMSWSKLAAQAVADTVKRPTVIKVDSYTLQAEPIVLNIHLLPQFLTLPFAPAALPDDGRMILIYDQSGDREQVAHYIRDLKKQRYQYNDGVRMIRGQRITISPVQGRKWLIDGQPIQFSGDELNIEVLPQVLRVISPQQAGK